MLNLATFDFSFSSKYMGQVKEETGVFVLVHSGRKMKTIQFLKRQFTSNASISNSRIKRQSGKLFSKAQEGLM